MFIKAIFGKNDRVVYLTAREHFVSHLLLWRACRSRYGVQHWKTAKTAHAVWSMAGVTKNNEGRLPSSWEVNQARVASSEAKRGDLHWTRRIGVSSETREKMSEARQGVAIGPMKEETKEKIRVSRRGKYTGPRPNSVGEAISRAKKGKPMTDAHKQALSKSHANRPVIICEICGRGIKGGNGNMKQHLRTHKEKL